MDYIKEYKRFINSHYLSDGVRITAGILLPAIILNYFGLLIVGVVLSLGAMCVSITDNPGPIQHRRTGMLICSGLVFLVSLLTGLVSTQPILLGVIIVLFCFLCSMIAVYGSRAISVGVAALLIMVLNIDRHYEGGELLLHSLYILAGGLWYTGLSLLLYSIRPYKLPQQALGECIMSTADYLRIRSEFYNKAADYDKIYRDMMEQQVVIHQNQELVRELLFKSRNIVKESTLTGRTLILIFTDIIDLFERSITSFQDYEALHRYFDNSEILQRYQELIVNIAAQLDTIGLAVKTGKSAPPDDALLLQLIDTREYLDQFRDLNRTADNIEGFINLRNILQNLEDIIQRVNTLHLYTTYDTTLIGKAPTLLDYERFITHQDFSPKLFRDNLSLHSNTFRHALRVSLATLVGYLISQFLHFGHSYWILLTIIVILKPAYSLTKKRNYERLLGTVGGAAIGLLILFFIKNNTVLFSIMLLLMIGTYSFLRTRYMLAVILMTPYILLLFHLLYKTNFEAIVWDRITDTIIGCVLALLANSFILPVWELQKINNYMIDALEKNNHYFTIIAAAFIGKPANRTDYKVSRKEAFVSLANLSDAFTRMLSEPKRRQKNAPLIQQFVALSQTLTSHIATLSYYAVTLAPTYHSDNFIKIIEYIISKLTQAQAALKGNLNKEVPELNYNVKHLEALEQQVNTLLKQRQEEIRKGTIETATRKKLAELKSITDQFDFITSTASEIKKLCGQIKF